MTNRWIMGISSRWDGDPSIPLARMSGDQHITGPYEVVENRSGSSDAALAP